MPRHVVEAKVIDVQKRRAPNKHYVYVLEITWSEGSKLVIYRRYSTFYDLHVSLMEDFVAASGVDGGKRIIPYLPGKKLIGRSQTHKVAEARSPLINEYVQSLVKLPQKLSRSPQVTNFFEPNDLDIKPPKINKATGKEEVKKKGDSGQSRGGEISNVSDVLLLDKYVAVADYKKQNKGELSFVEGQEFDVVEKADTGWWFVSADGDQGWVPATYLDSADDQNEKIEPEQLEKDNKYIAMQSYKAEQDDEIGFEKNAVLVVTEKLMDGWWKVVYQDKSGWAPGSFLKKMAVQEYQPVILGKAPTPAPVAPQRPDPVKSPPMRRNSIFIERASISAEKLKPISNKLKVKTAVAPSSASKPIVVKTAPAIPKAVSKPKPKPEVKKAPPVPTPPKKVAKNMYKTLGSFEKEDESGISFAKGVTVEVVEEDTGTGWTLIVYKGEEGWAPTDYLEKVTASATKPVVTPSRPSVARPSVSGQKPKFGGGGGGANNVSVLAAAMKNGGGFGLKPTGLKPGLKQTPPPVPAAPQPTKAKPPPVPAAPSKVSAFGGKGKTPASNSGFGAKAKPPAIPSLPKKGPAIPKLPTKPKVSANKGPVIPSKPKAASSASSKFSHVILANYKAESDSEVSLKKGEFGDVSDVADDWSFVTLESGKEGWAPSEFLEKQKAAASKPNTTAQTTSSSGGDSGGATKLKAKGDFNGQTDQELSIKTGEVLTQIEPDADGWIWAKNSSGKEGYVPSDFVQEL
eukprot:m.148622 g.148622  ORF g.148622 m.148622 type:complete len:742 (-) comp30610_c0_seq1:242-2467(-)